MNKHSAFKIDSDNGVLWSWYEKNLRCGNFEEIANNREGQIKLKEFIENIFDHDQFPYKLLFLSIPGNHKLNIEELESYLLDKFDVKSDHIVMLNQNHIMNNDDTDLIRYIIPISDHDFHLLEEHENNILLKEAEPTSTPEDTSYFGLTSDIIDSSLSNSMHKILSPVFDENDNDENGAIVLNFRKSSRHETYSPNLNNSTSNSYISTPLNSETMSLVSIQSYDYMNDSLYSSVDNMYPSLSRISAKNSAYDIKIKVLSLLGKDSNGSIWHAIRQRQSDDWIIYDDKFSLDNLEYSCSEDILLFNGIDKQVMILFSSIIM